jgi:hypothetical protein
MAATPRAVLSSGKAILSALLMDNHFLSTLKRIFYVVEILKGK